MNLNDLKTFLNEKVNRYNCPDFIENDPILIPHLFQHKKDIEISGFITATIAWGRRDMIIRTAKKIINAMGHSPFEFVTNYTPSSDFKHIANIKHRTFSAQDLDYFIKALQYIYTKYDNLESVFSAKITPETTNVKDAIVFFRQEFFTLNNDPKFRTLKHVSNPQKGSASKRINMFLRWMVRQDNRGVDFGLWKNISPSILSCPLDVHSGNIARELSLLSRKQNDWKALNELDNNLRKLDANDPVKYDFALFGLGVSGELR